MTTDEKKIPTTPEEEAAGLSWLWRWAHLKVILPLCVLGSLATLIDPTIEGMRNGFSPILLVVVAFASYMLVWGVLLLPVLLVRAVMRRQLNRGVSALLSLAGFVLLGALFAVYDEQPVSGSILMVLMVSSTYKVARSHFGLRSVGIPTFLGSHPSAAGAELPPLPHAATSQHGLQAEPAVPPTPAETPVQPAGAKESGWTALGIFCVLAYIAALFALLLVFVDRRSEDECIACAGVALLAGLVPAVVRRLIPDSLFKAMRLYREDNPGKAIAYGFIGVVVGAGWYGAMVLAAETADTGWDYNIYNGDGMQLAGYAGLVFILLLSQLLVPRLLRAGAALAPAQRRCFLGVAVCAILLLAGASWSIFSINKSLRYNSNLRTRHQEYAELKQQLADAEGQTHQARQQYEQFVAQNAGKKAKARERRLLLANIQAFQDAVIAGDAQKISAALKLQGVEVDAPMPCEAQGAWFTLTPLQAAVFHGHLAATQTLLEAGANPDGETQDCRSVLEALALCPKDDAVHDLFMLLVEKGMNPNCSYAQPLPHAGNQLDKVADSVADQFEAVPGARQYMRGKVADMKPEALKGVPSEVELTALHFAAAAGWADAVQLLLEKGAEQRDSFSGTPLYIACQMGHKPVAELLLGAGADINYRSHTAGWTPLMRSISSKHDDVALLLVARGADINACSKHGNNALWLAAMHGRLQVLECLLKAGADLASKEFSPLRVAITRKDFNCASLLLEYGMPTDVADKRGVTDAMALIALNGKDERWLSLLSPADRAKAISALREWIRRNKHSR